MGKLSTKKRVKPTEADLINADPNLPQNKAFFKMVLREFRADKKKEMVFLPCASGKKMGKKGFSCSTTHQFMSKIAKNPNLEKIVISDALGIVPYNYEPKMPYYNYPPQLLKPEHRKVLVSRTCAFLRNENGYNPKRKEIYYIGGLSHGGIVFDGNSCAGNPYVLHSYISPKGLTGYSEMAELLDRDLKLKQKKKEIR
jgi:hypothetical protein